LQPKRVALLQLGSNASSLKGNNMAGKAKSCYLTVCPKGKLQSVLRKVFFDAKALRDYIASDEVKAKFPESEYTFHKETY
jgi:hypothetical protein